MAVDLEAIKKKLAALNTKGGDKKPEWANSSIKLWKPEVGKYMIRVIPWPDRPAGEPFIEVSMYYVGDESCLMPPEGEKDPIAALRQHIYKTSKEDEAQKAIAKKLWPKVRTYVCLIDRAAEDLGPQLYAVGPQLHSRLLSFYEKKKAGDWMDIESGCDIEVEVSQVENKTFKDVTFDLDTSERTPLSSDPALVAKWMANLPSVAEFTKGKLRTPEQMEKMISAFIDGMPGTGSVASQSAKPAAVAASTPVAGKTASKPATKQAESVSSKQSSNTKEAITDIDAALAELEG